jgi:hypothetical protein
MLMPSIFRQPMMRSKTTGIRSIRPNNIHGKLELGAIY